jgi:adenine-specific DNA methylase
VEWTSPAASLPQFHSFAINDKITLASVMQQDNLHNIFQLPLFEEAYLQYSELEVMVQSLDITEEKDKWKYICGNSHYSSMKAYKYLSGTQQAHPVYRWLWASSCQLKHKVFV